MYSQIRSHLGNDIYPFHMPGHKRNPHFLPPNLHELDLTEIPGMDILSNPTGMILDLQEKIANFYGAGHSFLLVNGSSAGIIAAICAACADGDTLIVPRNAHASVYNGMVLSGAVPKYIMPRFTPCGLAGGICPSAFDDMPPGAAALVVSPTYEGFVSDIRAIADKVHARGGILIVDEAHGAHFAFHKRFPASALQLGADIVVHSLHKTLPTLSQTAVLHVNGSRVDINRIKFFVNAVQTSSPSYILMTVCDYALGNLWARPELFDEYAQRLDDFRAAVADLCMGDCSMCAPLNPIANLGRPQVAPTVSRLALVGATCGRPKTCTLFNCTHPNNAIFATDPGKLLFTTTQNAETVADTMAREHKIQVEMAAGHHILAMTSVADTDEGFARLKRALVGAAAKHASSESISARIKCECPQRADMESAPTKLPIPEIVIPPRAAIRLPSRQIPWEESAGQISAQLIAKYPPGIAIIAPGERIPPGIPKQSETIRVITSSRT